MKTLFSWLPKQPLARYGTIAGILIIYLFIVAIAGSLDLGRLYDAFVYGK